MVSVVGRAREVAALVEVLERRAACVVQGDPGIGKSALLAVAGQLAAERGFRVLTVVGVESEARFPFAGLHQLLRPVLDRADRLPLAQRDALRTAFGLAGGSAPEPFLVALAAVNLLAGLAAEQPIAVLADDVQWLDEQSHEALAFIARRTDADPVVVIGALRTGHPGPFLAAGLREIEVVGVDEQAAHKILSAHPRDLSAAEVRQIQCEAAGNPLALRELPAVWRTTGATDPQSVSLPAKLERAFIGRIAELPDVTRDMLLVTAVDPVDTLFEILAATAVLSGHEVAEDVVAPAILGRLVTVTEGHVGFGHPLVRSAVLRAETVRRRQSANAALAAVLADPYRRTWHRAQSLVGPDDRIADELETNASMALRRGAVLAAIRDLERSAQLTSTSSRRGHRLLLAAEQAFGLGRADLVDRLTGAARRTALSELDSARLEWLREIFHDGVPGDAIRVVELCDVAARSADAGDRDLALNLLLGAALRCWWADTGPAARARVVAVATGLGDVETDARYVAALAVAEPVSHCGTVLTLLDRAVPGDAESLRLLGMAAHAVGDEVRAADLLDRAETLLRAEGKLGLLPQVLSMQVQIRLELGDWDRAAAAAGEGRQLAIETGQLIWNAGTIACVAREAGLRGDAERALSLAAETELAANRGRLNDLLACVRLAQGCALLATNQPQAAYEQLRRLFDPADSAYHQRERFAGVMFLAEAAAAIGADVREVLADLERVAAATPAPILHVHLRYARAVLAPDTKAEARYREALDADLGRWPWARARIELAYGEWLRRRGRAAEARVVLRSAENALERIGATSWAVRARAEPSGQLRCRRAMPRLDIR